MQEGGNGETCTEERGIGEQTGAGCAATHLQLSCGLCSGLTYSAEEILAGIKMCVLRLQGPELLPSAPGCPTSRSPLAVAKDGPNISVPPLPPAALLPHLVPQEPCTRARSGLQEGRAGPLAHFSCRARGGVWVGRVFWLATVCSW